MKGSHKLLQYVLHQNNEFLLLTFNLFYSIYSLYKKTVISFQQLQQLSRYCQNRNIKNCIYIITKK